MTPAPESQQTLLPCPFCGSDAREVAPGFHNTQIVCVANCCQAASRKAWNTRTPAPVEVSEAMVVKAIMTYHETDGDWRAVLRAALQAAGVVAVKVTEDEWKELIREWLTEKWKDNYNHWEGTIDVLLEGCKAAKYHNPVEAADKHAGFLARAIMAMLNGKRTSPLQARSE